jgi:hypothetical protein
VERGVERELGKNVFLRVGYIDSHTTYLLPSTAAPVRNPFGSRTRVHRIIASWKTPCISAFAETMR